MDLKTRTIECFTINGHRFYELKGVLYDKPTPTTVSAELWQHQGGQDPVLRVGKYVLINKAYCPGRWIENIRARVDRVETRMVNGYERVYTLMTMFRPNHVFK